MSAYNIKIVNLTLFMLRELKKRCAKESSVQENKLPKGPYKGTSLTPSSALPDEKKFLGWSDLFKT